jgi:ribonuclease P protein component
MRFRAEQHLRRPADIRAVREQGQRQECRVFTLWWRRRPEPAAAGEAVPVRPVAARKPIIEGGRVCVIASTAAVGGAVLRNRAKRRLREVFRAHQSAVPAGCDLLLIARKSILSCPAAELSQRFTDACRRIAGALAT